MKAADETVAWLRAYYDAMDNGRYDEVATYLHEDIRTRYPTGDVLDGRAPLMKVTERSLGALERIRHAIVNVWTEDDELVFELDVTYWRKDGGVVERSGMAIFELRDGLIAGQRLFVDMRGVWDLSAGVDGPSPGRPDGECGLGGHMNLQGRTHLLGCLVFLPGQRPPEGWDGDRAARCHHLQAREVRREARGEP